MNTEIFLTKSELYNLQLRCETSLIEDILSELSVITVDSEENNYWDISDFITLQVAPQVDFVDKIQVVSLFMLSGKVIYAGKQYYYPTELWQTLHMQQRMKDNELRFLQTFWKGYDEGVITKANL